MYVPINMYLQTGMRAHLHEYTKQNMLKSQKDIVLWIRGKITAYWGEYEYPRC